MLLRININYASVSQWLLEGLSVLICAWYSLSSVSLGVELAAAESPCAGEGNGSCNQQMEPVQLPISAY